jgi:carboxyl-terminal processing protease
MSDPLDPGTPGAAQSPEQGAGEQPASPSLPQALAAHEPTAADTVRTAQRLTLGCAAVLVVFVIFVVGAALGFGLGRVSADDAGPGGDAVAAAGETANTTDDNKAQRAGLDAAFPTFWEAMDVLYNNFYGDLPAGKEATYAAIRGVVNNLDDPNTSFLSPDEAEVFRTNISGEFEGIGARVDWDEDVDTVRIVEPFENQPAWSAGLKRDDLILAVDGESVVGTDLTSAVQKIRGPKGTTVTLTILRPGANDNEPFDVEVVRARIETPTVTTDRLGDAGEIAYVRLYTFNENSGQLVRQAVEEALEHDAQGLILDLRGNTGGLLREAVKVTSLFLEDELVLLERFKNGEEEVYRTEGKPLTTDLPLVLIVNEGSASASEIVAGALQDTGRAPLLGAVTFGKGSVQLPETLSDGSILRVTIARWYTPKGRTIDGTGLTPDATVEFTDEQRAAGEDPQLDAALARVQELIAGQ